ncbi:Y-family DNA polymerase [Rubellimicrobium aerolatum]|uniref:DNA-directed DNA polymerase n=1 Tax=Rubellimicrobium aerolatum TaxID=490979 RepID=A0ABW0SBP5_9RHOB|nr:DNA polymerase Y family protein [Rubellimicrobium aerolatum]MBP1805862.1 protein ImuB [Rubellimicrobium aerolatum]
MAGPRSGAAILPFPLRAAQGRPGAAPPGTAPLPARPGFEPPGRNPARPPGRRFLSLALPRFAIERHLRLVGASEDALLALATLGPHGPVIHAATRAADAAGATPGLRVGDARSVCPVLRVEEADLAGDAQALTSLMLWSRRWCPWTAVEETGGPGLVLDVTGAAHLWGGEVALLREIETRLAGLGLSARVALAPTRGAAWALARFAGPRAICGPGEIEPLTAPLPVRALRLSPGTALLLQRLGLGTVGDLLAVPRPALARRFARAAPEENPLLRLDQLTGRLPEPLPWPKEPPRFVARATLSEPVQDPAPLLPRLAQELCARLEAKGFGARRLRLALFRTDGTVAGVEAATARPTRDAAHLVRLLEGRLAGLDPGFGFDLATLAATEAEPLDVRQPGLDGARDEAEDLARLLDRLGARFGPRALCRPVPRESHIPERALVWVPALGSEPPAGSSPIAPPGAPPFPSPGAPRPLLLLDPPEEVRVLYGLPDGPPAQFTWRRAAHRVARFSGPERIGPEWWRDPPGTRARDYWRVEDGEGRRFWLFREGRPGDGRGGAPRWFLHGLFA